MDEIKMLAEFVATVYGAGYRQGYGNGRSEALNLNKRPPHGPRHPDIIKKPIPKIPGEEVSGNE